MDKPFLCPHCTKPLLYTQAVLRAPDHLYCPDCRDAMYDPDNGEVIGRLIG